MNWLSPENVTAALRRSDDDQAGNFARIQDPIHPDEGEKFAEIPQEELVPALA